MSASRCRGSLVLATADRNRRLPLCWRAPSCRQKYRKTWRNVTRPIPPTCLPHGVAAACFVLATADKKAETHNHLSIHQWVRSAIFAPQQHASPIGFLFLKLPPPPCAVLLVTIIINHIWLSIQGRKLSQLLLSPSFFRGVETSNQIKSPLNHHKSKFLVTFVDQLLFFLGFVGLTVEFRHLLSWVNWVTMDAMDG